ncbi:MAG: Type I restriction-modification system, restriction subunit R [Cytophagales bacterium]|jgi:type I restriction enzyme R subunit|nr:MAG: Type I restriction-modification system, restriction subunit R [Cytophagales bacterium]
MAKPFNDIFQNFGSLMELLRDPAFQDLLENYERAKKVFLVGYEVEDEVKSEILFEANGKYGLKPEDYLVAFADFVKEKEKEIEAISILLNKPAQWNTKALNELKVILRANSFDETDLRKAHKVVYHKEVVDIISMVKHAARDTEPLLTPEERVNLAIEKITNGKTLQPEQQQWLEYIKEHLKQNMTLDVDDLNELPVFTDRGGLKKFKKVFPDFETIISEINMAIAA